MQKEMTNPAVIETGYVFDYSCIYNYLEKSHIIVAKKVEAESKEEEEEEEVHSDNEEGAKGPKEEKNYDINKGGRCPITGQKLLGCKWNPLKEEWQIEGIRRLIL